MCRRLPLNDFDVEILPERFCHLSGHLPNAASKKQNTGLASTVLCACGGDKEQGTKTRKVNRDR